MSIVIGYDDSLAAQAALEFALALAKDTDDCVIAVYGCERPGGMGEEYRSALDAVAELGSHALTSAQARALQTHVPFEKVLVEADPEEAMTQLAKSRGARMIVVGSDGPGTLRDALTRSISRRVLLNTTLPVVIVQPPDDAAH